jgi:hypothetical protein
MNLKIKPTTKVYYGQLYYKVTCDSEKVTLHDIYTIEDTRIWNRFYDLKIKRKDNQCEIFVKSYEQLEFLVDKIEKSIIEIHGPINEYHRDLLNDHRYQIKNSLYYNKYRYQAILGYDVNRDKELVNGIRDLVKENKDILAKGIWSVTTSSGLSWLRYERPRLYIKGKKELMLVRLAYEQAIDEVKEIITTKEIESNGENNIRQTG